MLKNHRLLNSVHKMQVFHFSVLPLMATLVSLNTRGLRSSDRWQTAFNIFRRGRFDIICLQETHWTAELEMEIKRDWDGEVFVSHGTNLARGVAVLISSRLEHNVRQTRSDSDGRILSILLDVDDQTINVVSVYAPRTDIQRRVFFKDLEGFLSSGYVNILGGDFNCVLDVRLDKQGGDLDARQSAAGVLKTISARHDLRDMWRERHRGERDYTWTGKVGSGDSFVRTRIDFFLVSKVLDQFVSSVEIRPYAHSDHDCIVLVLDFDRVQRGTGYWHFNNELLKDILFQAEIENFWGDWKNRFNDFLDPLRWWDRAKQEFKVIAIKRAKIRRKEQSHERFQLENQLSYLQGRARNGTTADIEKYLLAKEKLKQLDCKELEAIKIRVKAQYLEEGEKSTRYFFSLEKTRRADQTMKVLTKDNLGTVTDSRGLLSEVHAFYTDLYSAETCDENEQNEFLCDAMPRLTEEESLLCEGALTEEELRKALFSLENDKSPGIDGLTANFYKYFWPLFGPSVTHVYKHAFREGRLAVSQRRGITTLLFKKGDRTLLKNWRPITLLTTDYKILSKALANRLHRVLPFIVHSDQTASVKGRTIYDSTRLLHDVISYADEKKIPLAMISVDQLKAFDRVDHSFLFKTLERFGFGPVFRRWIQVIYNSVSSSVKTNGWLTAFITLERGLRQGCPLSMPLYVLTAETMAVNIRSNPRIRGILPTGAETELKLSQFADDTTLLLADDESITETFHVFHGYERAAGAKINKSKCKGLWCGSLRHRVDQLYGFDWYNDCIPDKILGQYFGNIDCSRRNWEEKIQKINNIIGAWCHRDLSLKGRALLINSLLTSTLWYNVTSLAVPSWAISQIEQAIYGFFWKDKQPLVNRDILALPLREGGFNIPRLETKIQAFRLNSLRKLLTEEDAHWKHFTAYFLGVANMNLGKMTLALDFSRRHINRTIPAFHKELLNAWSKHKEHRIRLQTSKSTVDILQEPLFLNELIAVQNKPLLYTDWIAAGIVRIKDICYEVVPGFLPVSAVFEMLSDQPPRPISETRRQFDEILGALPPEWKDQICMRHPETQPSVQPFFGIVNPVSGQPPTDILQCKTRHFYHQLHQSKKPVIPAIDYWKRTLQPEPLFDSEQWRVVFSPLITNRQGDLNWKIVHRVIPTALSLRRMGILDSESCYRCGLTDTIKHAFIDCLPIMNVWAFVQTFINRILGTNQSLSRHTKLLGKVGRRGGPLSKQQVDLLNWTLSVARYSIHTSIVQHRAHQTTVTPEALFKSAIKAHLRFKFILSCIRQNHESFKTT